jgi:hypothetical protein
MTTAEWIQVGEFMVASGKLIISDPCYQRGMWCAGVIENAKNGNWQVTVEITDRGRTLVATCEGPVGEMKKAPFHGSVDSAQVGIFCDSLFPSPWNPSPGFHKGCCEAVELDEVEAGIVLGGGAVSSVLEGTYRAYVGRNRDKQAVAVQITLEDRDEGAPFLRASAPAS